MKEMKAPLDWNSFATPIRIDEYTYGYKWNTKLVRKYRDFILLPEYYRLENANDPKKAKWVPVLPEEVPPETHLKELKFTRPVEQSQSLTPLPMTLKAVGRSRDQ
jgi:hypothetical protein